MRRLQPCSTSSRKWRWPAAIRASTITSSLSSPGVEHSAACRRDGNGPTLEEDKRLLFHDVLTALVESDLADARQPTIRSGGRSPQLDDIGHHPQRVAGPHRTGELGFAEARGAQAAGAEHPKVEPKAQGHAHRMDARSDQTFEGPLL